MRAGDAKEIKPEAVLGGFMGKNSELKDFLFLIAISGIIGIPMFILFKSFADWSVNASDWNSTLFGVVLTVAIFADMWKRSGN
jgi:hypothetical protein